MLDRVAVKCWIEYTTTTLVLVRACISTLVIQ
jgi:hypothetical protein